MDCQSFFRSFESGMVEEPETGIRVSSPFRGKPQGEKDRINLLKRMTCE